MLTHDRARRSLEPWYVLWKSKDVKKCNNLRFTLINLLNWSMYSESEDLFLVLSHRFLKSNRNFAHINLVLSLILAELLFVFGIDKIQYQVTENPAANNPPPQNRYLIGCTSDWFFLLLLKGA